MASKQEILNLIKDRAEIDLEEKRQFVPGKTRIPASFPSITSDDVATIADSLLSYWWTEHKWAEKFGRLLCERTDRRYAVLTNSGSSANLVAMSAAVDLYKSDKQYVLTCATGFPTTVSVIYQTGKIPFYVDIDPYTLQPDLGQIDNALHQFGSEICGAIFAHTLGFPYREDWITGILGSGRFLIADCCDALGTKFLDGVFGGYCHAGSYADYSTYSFFPAHHITSIEGGAVLCNTHERQRKAEQLVNWHRSCWCRPGEANVCGHRFDYPIESDLPEGWDHKYTFDGLGYNLKITDLQAALGYSQLVRLNQLNDVRWSNYKYLRDHLDKYEGKLKFVHIQNWSYPSPFGFPISVPDTAGFTTNQLIAYLQENKIETRRVFGGNLIRQPGFMNLKYAKAPSMVGSDMVMNNMFWIGCGPTMTAEMANYVLGVFDRFFSKANG